MRILSLAGLAALTLCPAPTAARLAGAQQDDAIVVRGDALARLEIERILDADNVDIARLTDSQIVAAMRAIPRGRAPADFWEAYQTHVRAWERFAAAGRGIGAPANRDPSAQDRAIVELGAADRAVNATFREVERIARLYGARTPVPRL